MKERPEVEVTPRSLRRAQLLGIDLGIPLIDELCGLSRPLCITSVLTGPLCITSSTRDEYKSRDPLNIIIQPTTTRLTTPTMTSSTSTNYMLTAYVVFLAVGAVVGQDRGVEVHGDVKKTNGQETQTLGASVFDQKTRLGVDGMRSGDYERGHVQIDRQLFSNADGTKSLNGHAGLSRDNFGNSAKNFGLGYADPKTSVNWDRTISGPLRTDTYNVERNFFRTNDGMGTIGGYAQHERNNFGMRDTQFGVRAGFRFRR
ncbi:hypothetical protein GE061_014896 [Apolygus lucorum]|uniref:Uncharacterized protein n=1 Tax=Apolygus lucorum TaxID=248454 RepID=A0A8S9XJG3_APOLU|nr:hypothetical protein GE061_014896 [Apolygus lucorum]